MRQTGYTAVRTYNKMHVPSLSPVPAHRAPQPPSSALWSPFPIQGTHATMWVDPRPSAATAVAPEGGGRGGGLQEEEGAEVTRARRV